MNLNNESSLDYDDFKPPELSTEAKNITLNLLPEKSKRRYTTIYNDFQEWRKTKNTESFSEEMFLIYFNEISKTLASSTLWARYSMLKATIQAYDNVQIESYEKLLTFLKRQHKGHTAKKSKTFTPIEVSKFCNEAPDELFLTTKVVLVLGVNGACRKAELTDLTMDNIEDYTDMLVVNIPKTKAYIERKFTITGDSYNVCKKYMQVRPPHAKTNRFLLQYRKGKFVNQPIGINTIGAMPKQIAKFLKLPNADLYTGHSFRRTSATLLIDNGADLTSLKRHGGWRSNAVAEGYIDNSLANKKKISRQIISSIKLNPSTSTDKTDSLTLFVKNATSTANLKRAYNTVAGPSTITSAMEEALESIEIYSKPSSPKQTKLGENNDTAERTILSGVVQTKNINLSFNNCNVTINMSNE